LLNNLGIIYKSTPPPSPLLILEEGEKTPACRQAGLRRAWFVVAGAPPHPLCNRYELKTGKQDCGKPGSSSLARLLTFYAIDIFQNITLISHFSQSDLPLK